MTSIINQLSHPQTPTGKPHLPHYLSQSVHHHTVQNSPTQILKIIRGSYNKDMIREIITKSITMFCFIFRIITNYNLWRRKRQITFLKARNPNPYSTNMLSLFLSFLYFSIISHEIIFWVLITTYIIFFVIFS